MNKNNQTPTQPVAHVHGRVGQRRAPVVICGSQHAAAGRPDSVGRSGCPQSTTAAHRVVIPGRVAPRGTSKLAETGKTDIKEQAPQQKGNSDEEYRWVEEHMLQVGLQVAGFSNERQQVATQTNKRRFREQKKKLKSICLPTGSNYSVGYPTRPGPLQGAEGVGYWGLPMT